MADARQNAIEIAVKAYKSVNEESTRSAFAAAGIGLPIDGSGDSSWRAFRKGELLGAFDQHRSLWRSTGVIHAVADAAPVQLTPFEHAPAIAAKIQSMREEYQMKLQGWMMIYGRI